MQSESAGYNPRDLYDYIVSYNQLLSSQRATIFTHIYSSSYGLTREQIESRKGNKFIRVQLSIMLSTLSISAIGLYTR